MAYGIVLRAPWPLPCCSRMGSVVGYGWVAYGFRWDFSSLSFVEVSVLSLGVDCWGGGFSYGLHVYRGFLVRCIEACTLFCSFYPQYRALWCRAGSEGFSTRNAGWTIGGGFSCLRAICIREFVP